MRTRTHTQKETHTYTLIRHLGFACQPDRLLHRDAEGPGGQRLARKTRAFADDILEGLVLKCGESVKGGMFESQEQDEGSVLHVQGGSQDSRRP